ncbi:MULTISPECIES: NAD(P)/FAD-dependent oxidoreductase [Halolamina]|uniref:Phytoene dehydrogenase-related protein n=1 Tax=Halolamina pelagica TaxID=699431 RepID=A0A1I5R7S8_9EURY|nr:MULTISPECIES: NAD(P)/FAD-dependent oxidoreductase [Halolamina]NHX35722.1 FAD-dependent oxidoreductase [Halolamina sp. R1-12]SFP54460.1 Phytoene dehydrogenase-related protein [Halolamina pelagica]
MHTIAVVGGGLAGLVAARRLADSGHDVTLFEERGALGGRVRSRNVDGFTCDRGFQVLFDAYPAVRRELDLDALSLRRFAPGGVICRPGSRSTLSDPLRDLGALLPSALSREISTADKLRTLRLRRRLTSGDWPGFERPDRSIREYLREVGFSERFVENFAAPLYGGITLDRSLSTSANVFEYTFRAMSLGNIVVPADGMAAVPAQLAERARSAGVDVRTGLAVHGLDGAGDRVRLATEPGAREFDAAVVATDPPTARDLTGVESIPTEGAGVVTQHYRLPGPDLDAGTRIMLNAGGEAPNTVAQLSAVAPEYGDDSTDALLAASFVDDGAQDRSADELAAQTREALGSWYPERDVAGLERLATDRIPFAQFAQPPGIHTELPDADDPSGPVYLAGDYTRWSSIQGALESGRRAAAAVDAEFDA